MTFIIYHGIVRHSNVYCCFFSKFTIGLGTMMFVPISLTFFSPVFFLSTGGCRNLSTKHHPCTAEENFQDVSLLS